MKRTVIGLATLAAVVIGAGFYIGWRVGYDTATSDTNSLPNPGPVCVDCRSQIDEPVIYLYPQKTEPVAVRVSYPAGFSYTSPAYNPASGWQVLAMPSGQLTNLGDNKPYPYLIWEGNPSPIKYDMKTGFVVPGAQTETFLRQELPIIGLSPSETDAFIAYWLPKMRDNKYNLIHFAGKEYTNYAKLQVSPRPDSVLRVLMAFEPVQQPIAVTPQTFPSFQRNGFTVVEWGGTELKR